MTDIDLKYAFGLKPEKAIEYFQAKGFRITWDWHEMLEAAHAKAFTVAKVMRTDILQDIHGELQKALDQGLTFADWKQKVTPRLKAKGWWGEVVNEATGEIANVGPHRLRTIYETNIQTSYMVGRYQQMMENATDRPWWMYVAVMDKRTRPAHSALNGLVFRFDDPFWDSHYPPSGFRCRCSVRALTDARLKEKVAAGEAAMRSTVGPNANATMGTVDKPLDREGKRMYSATTVKTTGLNGEKIAMAPDAGWSYNPGKAGWQPNLEKLDHRIARHYIADSLKGPDFERFFAGKVGGDFPIAVLRPEDKAVLGSETQTVWLSQESLKDHLLKHPEIILADYQRIPSILDDGEVYKRGAERLIYLKMDGMLYRAGIKRTKDKGRNYLLTLFKTSDELADIQVRSKLERIR